MLAWKPFSGGSRSAERNYSIPNENLTEIPLRPRGPSDVRPTMRPPVSRTARAKPPSRSRRQRRTPRPRGNETDHARRGHGAARGSGAGTADRVVVQRVLRPRRKRPRHLDLHGMRESFGGGLRLIQSRHDRDPATVGVNWPTAAGYGSTTASTGGSGSTGPRDHAAWRMGRAGGTGGLRSRARARRRGSWRRAGASSGR
jgi:hypothetical protein